MKSIVLTILLTILTTSCGIGNRTGKCYGSSDTKFRQFYINNKEVLDYTKYDPDIFSIDFERYLNQILIYNEEVSCPKELTDFRCKFTNLMKNAGIYEEAIKHINIKCTDI